MDLILGHKIDLVIDIPEQGIEHAKDGFVIRRNAIETGVNVLTAIDTATALVTFSGKYRYQKTGTDRHPLRLTEDRNDEWRKAPA